MPRPIGRSLFNRSPEPLRRPKGYLSCRPESAALFWPVAALDASISAMVDQLVAVLEIH